MRGEECKCREFKMHMKLRDQQIKTITHIQTAKPKIMKPKIYNRHMHKKEKGIPTQH